jgi:hypothetical protein
VKIEKMEQWNGGMMEQWNDGNNAYPPLPSTPILQYSNIPIFHIPADF